MELLFALLTAFCLARPTYGAIALGTAVVLVFVAHESFMVLIGRRGAQRRASQYVAARSAMVVLVVGALALLASALPSLSTSARLALAIPIALGAPTVALALAGRERSLLAEALVVAALTSVTIPVALASGAPLPIVVGATASWVAFFGVGTLTARGVLYRAKDQGRGMKLALATAVGVAALSIAVAALGLTSLGRALGPLPSTLVTIVIALRPPTPKQMTRLGLGLTAAAFVTLVLIVT